MFTGIVEEVGTIEALEKRAGLLRLTIRGDKTLDGTSIGDSISVSGVCLTVVAVSKRTLAVELVPETLRRSSLGSAAVGGSVNLERAMTLGRFFGGHYVQGHVDGTATIQSVDEDGEAKWLRFALTESSRALSRYFVPKGYVTIDGTSLTVVEADSDGFAVTLIPHTLASICLAGRAPKRIDEGATVNIEVDVVAKYVERFVQLGGHAS